MPSGVVVPVGAGAGAGRGAASDLVDCGDPVGALVAVQLGMPTVFEIHGLPGQAWLAPVFRRIVRSRHTRGVVAISDALRKDLESGGFAPHEPIIVAHDAADVDASAQVQRMVRTPQRGGYVGSLGAGRGIEMIIALAASVPEATFEIVGGSEREIASWRQRGVPANLAFSGFVPHGELASVYRRFDVLVMPHSRSGVRGASGGQDISRWTSPMKMFEYMACGVPFVASDLPVLQEVLVHDRNALIAAADDVEAWSAAVRRLLVDAGLRVRLGTP